MGRGSNKHSASCKLLLKTCIIIGKNGNSTTIKISTIINIISSSHHQNHHPQKQRQQSVLTLRFQTCLIHLYDGYLAWLKYWQVKLFSHVHVLLQHHVRLQRVYITLYFNWHKYTFCLPYTVTCTLFHRQQHRVYIWICFFKGGIITWE